MAYWKVRYFPGIPLPEKNQKPTDIHEHKHSVTATSNLDLSQRRALHIYTVGTAVLKVANMTTAFRDATPCGPKRSEGSWCLHLKDKRLKQHVPPKQRCIYTGLHPEFTSGRTRTDKANINAFTKLERQQFGEDQPSNITSLRGLAAYSKAHIFLQLAFYIASIDIAPVVDRKLHNSKSPPKLNSHFSAATITVIHKKSFEENTSTKAVPLHEPSINYSEPSINYSQTKFNNIAGGE